jgi:hypothetical protein
MTWAAIAGTVSLLCILVHVAAGESVHARIMLHHVDLWQQCKANAWGARWGVMRLILLADLSTIADVRLRRGILAARLAFWLFFPAAIAAKSAGL